ncbi:MAG: DUF58 domain-containing protein [Deltaproteobacteria bacterium]|jgi:uncharacterized protein (DUF58 family)|nr:DUF58 domain-containing protein [Deltaproteobacteria bacterium]
MSWPKLKPSNRIYIIPTKFGAAFSLGTIFMLLIGAAYQNNLVNLLGFFMLAILFTTMFATNNNLKGVEISRIEAVHGFASETLPISIVVRNRARKSKSNLEFTVRGLKKSAQYDARVIIPPASDTRLLATFHAPERGRHPLSVFVLSTTAPFGLFYSWQVVATDAVATVYPRRIGERQWSTDHGINSGEFKRASGAEDYKEHRNYQVGDNLRRVDWQAYARGRGLMTKDFDEAANAGLHFDFHRLGDLPFEKRLEQLSKWVDLAIQKGQPFSLSLPDKKLGPDQGLVFAHKAWAELADLKRGAP